MAYLLRYDEESREMVPKALPGAPFSHYYAQENSDEGIIMETDVGVKEVSELPRLTIQKTTVNELNKCCLDCDTRGWYLKTEMK